MRLSTASILAIFKGLGRVQLVFLCLFYVSLGAIAQDKQVEQSLSDIRQQINRVTSNLNANKKLLKSERDKLSILEQKIAKKDQENRRNKELISQQKQKLADLDKESKAQLEQQQGNLTALKDLLQQRYKQGSPDYLKLMLNQQDPYAVGRMSHYYGYFYSAQKQKLAEIEEGMQALSVVKNETRINTERLQEQQALLQQQTDELQSMRAQRSKQVQQLDAKVVSSSKELEQLKADRKRLNTLLENIRKQAEKMRRLKEQQRQKEEQQRRLAEKVPSSTKPKPTKPLAAGGFKKQQGRLPLPVQAPLKTKFGQRLSGSGMRSQGHFYATKKDMPVNAVFTGDVLFADYLKGYGLLIIIDHGDDHISLYGHNDVLYKKVGDRVKPGEVIAKSGVSGGLRQPGLYFEIRHKAQPVNPAKWLSR